MSHRPTTGQKGSSGAPCSPQSPSQLDSQQRDRLLLEQLPQVWYIARRIHDRLPRHVAIEDLINAGILGLLDALNRYDPSTRVQLKSYAKFRIRGAILDSLRDGDWGPRLLRQKARHLDSAEQRLRARLGRSSSEAELAVEMGMNLASFQELLGDLRGLNLDSLHGRARGDSEAPPSEETIAHPGPDPFVECLESEMKALLAATIGELPPRERQILALYYHEELTLKEVGAVLGVGESRVSQIHSATIIRLRARLRELLQPALSGVEALHPAGHFPPEGKWKKF